MQDPVNKNRLVWLAGLFDGDGCIMLDKYLAKKRGYLRFIPIIQISNTDVRIIKEIKKIFSSLNLPFYSIPSKTSSLKQKWDIRIQKRSSAERILRLLLPYLIGKKDQGTLLLDYLQESKLLVKHKRDAKNQKFVSMSSSKYRDFSEEVHHKLRALKKKR